MRLCATHHPYIARDGNRLQAESREDACVRVVVKRVRVIEPCLITIRGIGVLHRELAHANQATARTGFIAPFCLEVIDLLRKLSPGVHQLAEKVGHHLFVRHGENHVASATIFESTHLRADLVVSSCLPPEIGGVNDRHQHLLSTDGVHLFSDHLGHVHIDAHAERKE